MCRIFRSVMVASGFLALVCWCGEAAGAEKNPKKNPGGVKNSKVSKNKGANTPALAQSNALLVKVQSLLGPIQQNLEMANHNYNGHRALAVRHLIHAQKELTLALKSVKNSGGKGNKGNKGTKGTKGTKVAKGAKGTKTNQVAKQSKGQNPKGGAITQPQGVSNTRLVQSAGAVEQTVALLSSAAPIYHGHRGHAMTELNRAMQELQRALQFDQRRGTKQPTK